MTELRPSSSLSLTQRTEAALSSAWANAEPIHRPLTHVVAELRARTGGDVGVHGSITLAQVLLAQGLVVDPVGPRLCAQMAELRELTLISATPIDSRELCPAPAPAIGLHTSDPRAVV